jgi:hypothetical protein
VSSQVTTEMSQSTTFEQHRPYVAVSGRRLFSSIGRNASISASEKVISSSNFSAFCAFLYASEVVLGAAL